MARFLEGFFPATLIQRLILIGLFIGVATAGFIIGVHYSSSPSNSYQTESPIYLGKTDFINPLLDYESDSPNNPILNSLKAELETQVIDFKNHNSISELSVFYRNLDTNEWFGINEGHSFAPASLMKVTLMIVYYKLAETNPGLLAEEITYEGQYAHESNLPPAQLLAIGESYTVEEMIERMIIESDNISRSILSNYLDERFDIDVIDKLAKDSEVIVPANYEKRFQFEITPKDYSRAFRVLYNSTYLTDAMSEKALRLLSQSSYDSGIVNGIPDNIVVANKFGYNNNPNYKDQLQFHDCGVVYTKVNPYILCIMTKTTNVTAAQEVISSLSQTIYNTLHDNTEDSV